MNYLTYIFRFFYRIRWWLILCPIIVAAIVYVKLGRMPRKYTASTTIYTGIVSGYDIETGDGQRQDWNVINNTMDNLINIASSQTTLKNVSMQLYAQDLSYGDPEKDNTYMLARSYRILQSRTPDEVKALVDRNNDSITLQRLWEYEKADRDNHVYGMFLWNHRHYSYNALRKIKVRRVGNSDMLEISYTNDDPGIVYNTLDILNKEFVKQYTDLRFGQTNDVIAYFERELRRVRTELHGQEDSLTAYNVANHIIHYDEQTRHVASLTRDYELQLQSILLDYNGSAKVIETIENKIEPLRTFSNNALFLTKLQQIADLNSQLASAEAFRLDTLTRNSDTQRVSVNSIRNQLDENKKELQVLTETMMSEQYTKEGMSANSMVRQWLEALLTYEKSKAELEVMKEQRKMLDREYERYSPIGSTLNRRERNIDFLKQSYMSNLHALNTARLKQKSLQMSSATLKVINPPVMPLNAEPSKRKLMVVSAFLCTLLFVIGFFVLLELLDRTLRDKMRAERITRQRVLGAFPAPGRLSSRRYTRAYRQIASRYMANAIVDYFKPGEQNLVNLLSTDSAGGKSELANELVQRLTEQGFSVRLISWNKDFNPESRGYLLARKVDDLLAEKEEQPVDVTIAELPPLSKYSVPRDLLRDAVLNLVVARADRVWKDTDQMLLDKAIDMAHPTPVMLYLNYARREVVETFTGLLPPYTALRKLGYRIYQFGFTSSAN